MFAQLQHCFDCTTFTEGSGKRSNANVLCSPNENHERSYPHLLFFCRLARLRLTFTKVHRRANEARRDVSEGRVAFAKEEGGELANGFPVARCHVDRRREGANRQRGVSKWDHLKTGIASLF